jgi:hypothetical protein
MQINPPFGYQEVIPITRAHRVARLRERGVPDFCRHANAIPISFTEFTRAARDYPIVFVPGDSGKHYTATAVLGIEANQNLFLQLDGTWDANAYMPAYLRRYPFCMSKITVDGKARDERIICVEKQALSETGEALYNETGAAQPQWETMQKFLAEFEADLDRGEEMCGILRDFGLLEAFTMQAELNQGGSRNLTGMCRVEEKKLEYLSADQYRTLIKKGVMGKIYLHLSSLGNFARLLDRSMTRRT